jgi:hypothetical protein
MTDAPMTPWSRIVIGRLQDRIIQLQDDRAVALAEIDRLTKGRDALIEQLAQCRRDYDGLVLVLKEDVEMLRLKSEAQ